MNKDFVIRLAAGFACFLIPSFITGQWNIFGFNESFLSPLIVVDYICRTLCFLTGILLIVRAFTVRKNSDQNE